MLNIEVFVWLTVNCLKGLRQETSCSCLFEDYGILFQVKRQFSL